MLSYKYSSKILDGIFGKNIKKDDDDNPILDAFGEVVYEDVPIVMDEGERDIYLGLFVENPDSFGKNGREPGHRVIKTTEGEGGTTTEEEVWEIWPEYSRIWLNRRSRIDKDVENLSLASMVALDPEHPEKLTPTVQSQEMILFPEAYGDMAADISDEDAGWGVITGFGLYYATRAEDPEAELFLWGEITGENGEEVKIQRYQVPVIRKGGLTISLS